MTHPRLTCEESRPELVARLLAERLTIACTDHGTCSLAIPGGRSPGPVLRDLAAMLPDGVRQRLHLFWVDERAVPAEHRDRNDRATLADWAEGGPLPGRIHAMPAGEADLDAAAAAYARTISEACAGRPLDAVLLGLGDDGHIASLFPGSDTLDARAAVTAVIDAPKPPARRLTLTLPTLNAAGLRVILAVGTTKHRLVERILGRGSLAQPLCHLPVPGSLVALLDPS